MLPGSAGERAHHDDQIAALQELVAALERRNHELDDFACAVGHDLRSPIRTARALAELADRRLGEAPTELSDLLGRIEVALDRLDHRVSALLRLARVGRTSVELQACGLHELVARVAADLTSDLQATGASVHVTSDGADLHVDPELFSEVLQNLIANAITYTCEGSPPEIDISSSSTRSATVVTVADNGPGIAAEDRERALQMFERLHDAGTGTGAGLALCARIVEAHDGHLWLDDRPGRRGLAVRIWIPHLRPSISIAHDDLDLTWTADVAEEQPPSHHAAPAS